MYGASARLLELFTDRRDVLVVVDDWRGSDAGAERAPVYFTGRAFYRRDWERLDELLRLLDEAKAAEWHARKRFSLFTSDRCTDILDALDRCQTRAYTLNGERRAFEAAHLDDQWKSVREGPVGEVWKTNAGHAKALYVFLTRLGQALVEELPRGLRYRVLVDRLDWLNVKGALPYGATALGATADDTGDVWTVIDRNNRTMASFLPLLGLIDSEAWAWGRLQRSTYPDGSTVRDRMLAWLDKGKPDDGICTQEELDHVLNSVEPTIREYWEKFMRRAELGQDRHLHV
jgi:hypothetical protein